MTRRRKYLGTASVSCDVDVDIADFLDDIESDVLLDELARRSGGSTNAPDLIGEVRWFLIRNQPQAALALIEGFHNAARITEEDRAKQYVLADRFVARGEA